MKSGTTVERPAGGRARIRQSRLGTLVVLGVTTVLVMAGAYLVERPKSADGVTAVELTGDKSGPPPEVGRPVQDFTATTIDGKQVSLSGYRGQAVWLTFGATWCADCRAEAPDIQGAYEKAKANGVVVLSVYLNEDTGKVRDYSERLGLNYVHVSDPDTTISSAYRVIGIPAHFFIDRSGVLRSTKVGVLDREAMDSALADISK